MTDYQRKATKAADDAASNFSNKDASGLAAIAYAILHLADVLENARKEGGDV